MQGDQGSPDFSLTGREGEHPRSPGPSRLRTANQVYSAFVAQRLTPWPAAQHPEEPWHLVVRRDRTLSSSACLDAAASQSWILALL